MKTMVNLTCDAGEIPGVAIMPKTPGRHGGGGSVYFTKDNILVTNGDVTVCLPMTELFKLAATVEPTLKIT